MASSSTRDRDLRHDLAWSALRSHPPAAADDDPTRITVVYTRKPRPDVPSNTKSRRSNGEPRVSFAPARRPSWNRSLNTRGRSSIVVAAGVDLVPDLNQKGAKKKLNRPPRPKKSGKEKPVDFRKEISYFQEVDADELLEESPSPKHLNTWVMGMNNCHVHDLSSILERWRISRQFDGYRRSGVLFGTLETPGLELSCSRVSEYGNVSRSIASGGTCQRSVTSKSAGGILTDDTMGVGILGSLGALRIIDEGQELAGVQSEGNDEKDKEGDIGKVSLTSCSLSLTGECRNAFSQLLDVCRQTEPLSLSEVFSQICDPSSIVKIGEGTYGEAFRAGNSICKVVPIDGDMLVNGEVQKRSEEVLEEVLLSLTLNALRGLDGDACSKNSCNSFIETKDCRICRGSYSTALVSAWEEWDLKHGSENDNPKEFSDNQCYIVFVLADGGQDLESFVLLNYDEAHSLLVQVAASLAVAEVACEFEHRDLHWGNILLSRKALQSLEFCLEGRMIHVTTNSVVVSIIDFTLSRINTGEAILFLDLSSDPGIFEGPKGDKQAETYRKMKEVTQDCWEGSFPKTNVLWLQYLVDILLLRKSFKRTKNDERELRSLRKRLNSYNCAREALADSFFTDLCKDVTGQVGSRDVQSHVEEAKS